MVNHTKMSSCYIVLTKIPSMSDLPVIVVVGLTAPRPSIPSNDSPPAPAKSGRRLDGRPLAAG